MGKIADPPFPERKCGISDVTYFFLILVISVCAGCMVSCAAALRCSTGRRAEAAVTRIRQLHAAADNSKAVSAYEKPSAAYGIRNPAGLPDLLNVPGMTGWGYQGQSAFAAPVFPVQLILEMFAVAIQQGSSIPRALEAVGSVMGDGCGRCFAAVSSSLCKGQSWDDAWGTPAITLNDIDSQICALIRKVLEPSWRHGASPLIRIETAIDEASRRELRAVDDAAHTLSVKVLLPLGLCFLPAFVTLTVIPSLATWVSTMWN